MPGPDNRWIIFFLLWVPVGLLSAQEAEENLQPQPEIDSSTYRLYTGDRLNIQVYREPDLSREVEVDDKGIIIYPLLGRIKVADLTAREVEKLLTDRLKGDYLINPEVTVTILKYREFYVTGEVKRPGGYAYSPGMTVEKAVILAGGFTAYASRSRIYVVREGDARASPQRVELDTPIYPGDTLRIEESFF